MIKICLFWQIAFSLYLVDVKGQRTNLFYIHYVCIINDDCRRHSQTLLHMTYLHDTQDPIVSNLGI